MNRVRSLHVTLCKDDVQWSRIMILIKRMSDKLTMACSILLSMATTLAPEELRRRRNTVIHSVRWCCIRAEDKDEDSRQSKPKGSIRGGFSDRLLWDHSRQFLPVLETDGRRALSAQNRRQKRDGKTPQLTNTDIHRHRVTRRIHSIPPIKRVEWNRETFESRWMSHSRFWFIPCGADDFDTKALNELGAARICSRWHICIIKEAARYWLRPRVISLMYAAPRPSPQRRVHLPVDKQPHSRRISLFKVTMRSKQTILICYGILRCLL